MKSAENIDFGPKTTYYYFIDGMGLTPTQRLIYMRVLNFTLAGKDYFQDFESLGHELGLKKRAVYKAMDGIISMGYIVKTGPHSFRADLDAITEPVNN
jgi:biotin operon repressor